MHDVMRGKQRWRISDPLTGLFRGLGLDIVDPVIFTRQPDPGKDLFGLVLESDIATKVGVQVGLQLGSSLGRVGETEAAIGALAGETGIQCLVSRGSGSRGWGGESASLEIWPCSSEPQE